MVEPEISIVIPSYNEMKNLSRGVLDEVNNYLLTRPYTWEVILSDDGSTDGTLDLLSEFCQTHPGFKLLRNQHAGKAPTVKAGMLTATGEWRLFTDFDQSTPLSELEKLLPFCKLGYQVIFGSREIFGSLRDKEPFYRHLMGRGFNFLVQLLAVPGVQDTQCGFKLFSAAATTTLFNRLVIYGRSEHRQDAFTGAFDVELLYLARRFGFSHQEVPIKWRHFASDRVSPIRDSLRMLWDILRIRFASFTGKYAVKI